MNAFNSVTFSAAVEARSYLARKGYLVGFSSPGRPTLWAKLGTDKGKHDRRAILHTPRGWAIVPYPMPASVSQFKIAEHSAEGYDK